MNEIMILTGFALAFGIIITVLEHYISKKAELKINFIEYLPGYNCGACGFGSCQGLAEELEVHPENYKKCRPLKPEEIEILEEVLRTKHK